MRNLTVAGLRTLSALTTAATDEFHESDVLWPDQDQDRHQDDRCCHGHQKQLKEAETAAACGGEEHARRGPAPTPSAPVTIPVALEVVMRSSSGWRARCGCYEDDEQVPFVPPHVALAARRRCPPQERAASSAVCVGQGRTLKGRDDRCVRTAVLRMTGFLET